ncbi:MAG: hypothetical protein HYV60_22330 [Planctomycetia bacterium]|nr:hypothetical protein [Planctomycetia bacterium]
MKRLTILTVIAMVTVATSSGCRTCGSPFSWFNRGVGCDTCSTTGSDTYASSYGSGMTYEGDTMLPPVTTEVLPGPQPAAR